MEIKLIYKFTTAVIVLLLFFGCFTPQINHKETYSDFDPVDQWKEVLIADILSKTQELNTHQMNGQNGNQVFINDDGREAVYDAQGELVTDPVNQGSYNYYHPVNEPLAHFAKDIHPWLKWGNTRDDPSTKEQRLNAYLKDLKAGIISAFNEQNISVKSSTIVYQSETEKDVVMLFLKIISESGDDSLFSMYEDTTQASENRLNMFLKNIQPVFLKYI